MIKKLLHLLLLGVLHLTAATGLAFLFWQIGSWYIHLTPARGVDLYNSATYVMYNISYFPRLFSSFKDFWYAGYPLLQDFPQLTFLLMIPFALHAGPLIGAQLFAVVSFFLLLVFSYFLFYQLSKNGGLAFFLTVLVMLSPNMYGSLIWAGSIPYFASQCFLPLSLFVGARYLRSARIKGIAQMSVITGLTVLFHPLSAVTYIIPFLFMLICAGGILAKQKVLIIISRLALFSIGFVLCGFIFTHIIVVPIFTKLSFPSVPVTATQPASGAATVTQGELDIANFHKEQINLILKDSHSWILWSLAITSILAMLGLGLGPHRKQSLVTGSVFTLIALYAIAHPVLNLTNTINFLRHNEYRAFWQIPITTGALVACFYGIFYASIHERVKHRKKSVKFIASFIFSSGIAVILVVAAVATFNSRLTSFFDQLVVRSEISSAFPEILGINREKEQLLAQTKKLLPTFINPRDKNKRLYASDATVNIWWNTFFDTPLVRGYLDPPIGIDRRGGFFLLDVAIGNDSLVRDFKYNVSTAKNYALFFMDWYGVHFFEGGHVVAASTSNPPSSYLLSDDIFSQKEEVKSPAAIIRYGTQSGHPEVRWDLEQSLIYYKLNEKYTSPVLAGNNAQVILVVSDDPGYEQIWRGLAFENKNSQQIIPIQAGKFVDSVSESELDNFDAIVLHNYSYKNSAKFKNLLSAFLAKGKSIFVDTGGDIKDSESTSLPDFFPVLQTTRGVLGSDWDFDVKDTSFMENIDLNSFGRPMYNADQWKFSYATPTQLQTGAKIILENHGKVILAEKKTGLGKVVWSGMNLGYHLSSYPTPAEGAFFNRVIANIVPQIPIQTDFGQSRWLSPEKAIVTTANSRGVLFKEQYYDGWSARLASGEKLSMYRTGPTYPGFMYVPLPKTAIDKTVEFTYKGKFLFWFAGIVNILALLIFAEKGIFDGKLIINRFYFVVPIIRQRFHHWWHHDGDE